MLTVVSPSEERVILHNVSWATYERLLADFANHSVPHLTFDRGVLEIMTPLPEHEKYNRLIALLVAVVADALGTNIADFGSTTFKRSDLERGFEPDSCFYIQHEPQVRGKSTVDLHVDPPPDLIVEVKITRGSLNKLPLYAQVGVPEVWRYDGRRSSIFKLERGDYIELEKSEALPSLTSMLLTRFLDEGKVLPHTAWLRMLREWAAKMPASGD